MNNNETFYALNEMLIETARLLKISNPKLILVDKLPNKKNFNILNGTFELQIKKSCLFNIENDANIFYEFFYNIRLLYQSNAIKNGSILENDNTIKEWKNENFKRMILNETDEDFILLKTNIDACAFSVCMVEKFFNLKFFPYNSIILNQTMQKVNEIKSQLNF